MMTAMASTTLGGEGGWERQTEARREALTEAGVDTTKLDELETLVCVSDSACYIMGLSQAFTPLAHRRAPFESVAQEFEAFYSRHAPLIEDKSYFYCVDF